MRRGLRGAASHPLVADDNAPGFDTRFNVKVFHRRRGLYQRLVMVLREATSPDTRLDFEHGSGDGGWGEGKVRCVCAGMMYPPVWCVGGVTRPPGVVVWEGSVRHGALMGR